MKKELQKLVTLNKENLIKVYLDGLSSQCYEAAKHGQSHLQIRFFTDIEINRRVYAEAKAFAEKNELKFVDNTEHYPAYISWED